MAEFCVQCARDEMGFEPDSVGLCKPGEMISFLCEGCGPTWVDDRGVCISDCLEHHYQPPANPATVHPIAEGSEGYLKLILACMVRKLGGVVTITQADIDQVAYSQLIEDGNDQRVIYSLKERTKM